VNRTTVRKVVDWVLGLTLIGIGVLGGFVPVLQGWVFIVAGLAVLSSHSRWAKAIYGRIKRVGRSVKDRVVKSHQRRN
jgi:uncharacterized membrane protein YbaN (DUF454 family)